MINNKIFTFWEGRMPDYICLCMKTWKFPHTILDYSNLANYTSLEITPDLLRFTLPQIADVVRVHVLRDQGGYWLDADTIMINNKLPTTNMIGDPAKRTNTIGYLHTEPHSPMFEEWATYQDKIISNPKSPIEWSVMGNDFTDEYVKNHPEITITSVENCWPETYMVDGNAPRPEKYIQFYFEDSYNLDDIKPTNMLMLHNSWTPGWYKQALLSDVLDGSCTLSNVLRKLLTEGGETIT